MCPGPGIAAWIIQSGPHSAAVEEKTGRILGSDKLGRGRKIFRRRTAEDSEKRTGERCCLHDAAFERRERRAGGPVARGARLPKTYSV